MKKIIFYLLYGFFTSSVLISCSSEHSAKKAIKGELRLTLHDYKSYEPVSYGKLEVATSSYEDLPEYVDFLDEAERFLEQCKEYRDKMDIYDFEYSRDRYLLYSGLHSESLTDARISLEKADSIKLHFVPEPIGWKMKHSFRAKNLAGNLGIHHYEFYFDKEMKNVTKSIDLSENTAF